MDTSVSLSHAGRPDARPLVPAHVDGARVAEWDARPLGRLGRRLLPEIDTYLEFFAIARGY
jgi:hypothetical protein